MKTRTLQNLVVAGMVLSLASPAIAAEDPATAEALTLYKAGKYSLALSKLEAISAKKPSDPIPHYYMALCLQGLNQVARANSEYQLTINNTRNPKLKAMAEQGQETLNRYSTTRTKPASGAPPAAAADTKTAEKKDETTDSKDKTASEKTDGKDAKGKDGKADPKTATAGAGKVKKVLVFMNSWDRMCLAFEPALENARGRLSGKVDIQKVDTDSEASTAMKEKYGIGSSLPVMVYLDEKGKALATDSSEDIEGQVDRLNGKK